jgi:hypothetical protein
MESQFVSPKKFQFVFTTEDTESENKYTFVDNMEQRCLHGKNKQDLLGQVSRLRKREEQIHPLEWVGPEVR